MTLLCIARAEEQEAVSSICGADDRVLMPDARIGRTHPLRCTAFLFDGSPNSLLTAGHCCSALAQASTPYVEFNVPLSSSTGAPQSSAPEDQYVIDKQSIQIESNGLGNDWCVFGVYENAITGMTPLAAQGAESFRLAQTVPTADLSIINLSGYGADLSPKTYNRTLQIDSGPFTDHDGTVVWYSVDSDRGNSGSPIEASCPELIYAIHVEGWCHVPNYDSNAGTAIYHPGLQDALANPLGVCADCNQNGTLDSQDITAGTSQDCNNNGIPDECEFDEDCQLNGTQDICDIANGTSSDLNGNRIPDECESQIGACCRDDGGCSVMSSECCEEISGTYQGDATVCANPEVCCLGDGTCELTPSVCCIAAFGTILTEYSECGGDCNDNDIADACEAMACCVVDRFGFGTCIETTEDECAQLQGAFSCGSTCNQVYCAGTSGPQGP